MSRLERWSRRKRGLETEPPAPPEAMDPPRTESPPDELPEASVSPGALDDSLPDPDTLPPGSDFSQYLQQGVSQALKRRALRRLWQSEGYGARDGLDDYDHDYTRLKPLAREVAERLRHWTRQVDEALSEPDDAPPALGAQTPDEPTLDGAPEASPSDEGAMGNISQSRQD